jgi:hypothetical protein
MKKEKSKKFILYPRTVLMAVFCVMLTIILLYRSYSDKEKNKFILPKKECRDTIYIHDTIYLGEWEVFKKALTYVESRNNDSIIGRHQDHGRYQITPIFLNSANIQLMKEGLDTFDIKEMHDPIKADSVFEAVQRKVNPEKSIERAMLIHNPKASSEYRKKVIGEMERQLQEMKKLIEERKEK